MACDTFAGRLGECGLGCNVIKTYRQLNNNPYSKRAAGWGVAVSGGGVSSSGGENLLELDSHGGCTTL